jgi:preprotein translocase subunit SecG
MAEDSSGSVSRTFTLLLIALLCLSVLLNIFILISHPEVSSLSQRLGSISLNVALLVYVSYWGRRVYREWPYIETDERKSLFCWALFPFIAALLVKTVIVLQFALAFILVAVVVVKSAGGAGLSRDIAA